ncbi:WecB/TagA/CpsF family glycosyltransferase [Hyphomicrobium facile]|uniref:Polymer biosynthesis protein, WecB/TagA/CpsF family n=1 Tax=Hyphomicrobium facile TaxID=51670 RepID=A0A1I7NVN0_9HYPH|nr:WecB/TagA/CpsF family glycosyltransferase [Hyphomicrobium facile]SFV38710.1 polymer biosynthesis protein, WecB/TagA/CpsF family [Hyphomicrobium facile]
MQQKNTAARALADLQSESIAKPPSAPLAHVGGWPINTPDMDTAIASVINRAGAREAFTVFTLNLDHLVKLRSDERFRLAYREADIVTADGAPVAWLARLQDRSIVRATGSDMLLPLLDAAADARLPVFLFGSTEDVLAKAAHEIADHTDGLLKIAGMLSPSRAFDPEGAEADRAIETIRRSGARICIVALGAPKQEIFAERARAKGLACGMVCAGASLDFVARAQVRAPKLFRKLGFEWMWRLATNPRRLAKRYVQCAIVLGHLVIAEFAERRPAQPGPRV